MDKRVRNSFHRTLGILLAICLMIVTIPFSTEKVRAEGEESPSFPDNQHKVYFDSIDGASVKVNNNNVVNETPYTFTYNENQGEELRFSLTPPENRKSDTPIVTLIVHSNPEVEYSTKTTGENKINLENNSFTFTPTSAAGFDVFIAWSEYDAFGPTDEKPVLVELECQGEGTVNVADTDISNEDKSVDGNWTKVRVPGDRNSLTLTWEYNAPTEIRVEGGTTYNNLSGNSQTIELNKNSDNYCRVIVFFEGENNPIFPDNQYKVYFDSIDGASVKVNNNNVVNETPYTFTYNENQGEELRFSLTPPENRKSDTPIVTLIVHSNPEVEYSTKTTGENKINLENNSFTFTPTSAAGFDVFIAWSEYDAFGPTDNKPVLVELECEGEGTVNVDDIANEDKFVDGNWTKVRVAVDIDSLTLTWGENRAPREVRVEGGGDATTEGWLIIKPTGTSCEIPLTQKEEDNSPKTYYRVQVDFNNGGGSGEDSNGFNRLQTEMNATYFAFGDIDNSGNADTDDLKYGVMRILYDGFRVNEGRYQREGAALGLKVDNKNQDHADLNANMEKLLSITTVNTTPISGDTITATDKSGTSYTFNAYEIKITINKLYNNRSDLSNFPNENEATSLEEPIVLTTKAYLINMPNSSEQVIIKVKDNYFVRDAHSEAGGNEDDLETFEGLNARALIVVSDFDKVSDIDVFGNYASKNETLSDESSDCYFASGFGTGDDVKYLGDKFIVMKPAFLGVTINGKDETKSPLAWSVESSLSIAETGKTRDTKTDIYFGFHTVEIAPVKTAGLQIGGISAVEVLDEIPEHAVKVENSDNGKYIIQFLSDYYDTVRVKVTYSLLNGGTDSGIMTLNRVGIMIQGGMTAGDSHTVNIFHGHDMGATLDSNVYDTYKSQNSDKTHGEYGYAYYATYYYPTSSQATSADVSLFVTYTYEDGSVKRKLLESNYFTSATEDKVAMSDYILYMGDGSNAPVKVEAIAVPNANADGTIQGAKLGAGKGVEKVFDFSE